MISSMKTLTGAMTVLILAGCTLRHEIPVAESNDTMAPPELAGGVGRPPIPMTQAQDCRSIAGNSTVLLIAINKAGKATAYPCTFVENGQDKSPRPKSELPLDSGVSPNPTEGNIIVYEFFPGGTVGPNDPCISLGSGGSKYYYCW